LYFHHKLLRKCSKETILIFILVILIFIPQVSTPLLKRDSDQKSSDSFNKLNISGSEITIITPENITYTKPMSGYYPATYGFEDDDIGTIPEKWIEYKGDALQSVAVILELDGHRKVVDINKENTYGTVHNLDQNFTKAQEFGEVELWIRTTQLEEEPAVAIMSNNGNPILGVHMKSSPDVFGFNNNTGWYDVNKTAMENHWYHIKIQFECGIGNHYGLSQYFWRFYVDGEEFGDFSFIK